MSYFTINLSFSCDITCTNCYTSINFIAETKLFTCDNCSSHGILQLLFLSGSLLPLMHLTLLTQLFLDNNWLTGSLTPLQNLTGLTNISICCNHVDGIIFSFFVNIS